MEKLKTFEFKAKIVHGEPSYVRGKILGIVQCIGGRDCVISAVHTNKKNNYVEFVIETTEENYGLIRKKIGDLLVRPYKLIELIY